MKTLKTKRFKVLCILGLSALGVYLLHVYCQFTGNNHEPQRGRPAQESIGKICAISDLKSFGAPPHSGDALPFYIDDWIDGPKAAEHSTLIKTFASREEIHQHYIKACQREGYTLDSPSPADYDIACTKKEEGSTKSFVEHLTCNEQMCEIALELFTH